MTKTLPLTEKEKVLADLAKIEDAERVSSDTQRTCNILLLGVQEGERRLLLGKTKLASYRELIAGLLTAELDTVIRMRLDNFLESNPGESIRLYHQNERAAESYTLFKVNELRFADGEDRYIAPLEIVLEEAKVAFAKFRAENPSVIPGVEPIELKRLIKP